MIVVTGTIRLQADKLDAARPHLRALIEATRKEEGCIAYDFGEDAFDPGRLIASEAWRDEAALAAHLQTAHFAAWIGVVQTVAAGPPDLTVYEIASSRPL